MEPVVIGPPGGGGPSRSPGPGRPLHRREPFGSHEPREPRTRPLLRTMLGDVLRRTRLAQGRTLADVARAARVSMPYLSELERGRKEASSEILAAICEALHIGLSDLLAEIQRSLRAGRAEQADLADPAERAIRADLAGRAERAERADHTELAERASRAERAECADRAPVIPLDAVRSARISPPVPQAGDVRPVGSEPGARPRPGSGDLTCLLAA